MVVVRPAAGGQPGEDYDAGATASPTTAPKTLLEGERSWEDDEGDEVRGAEGATRAVAEGDVSEDGLWYPPDWDEWVDHMSACRRVEAESLDLARRLRECAREERFEDAVALQKEIENLLEETPDALRLAMEELETLVREEDFAAASRLRDAAGTRYSGWWVGRCEERSASGGEGSRADADAVDPFGHVVAVEPRFSSLCARGFSGSDLPQAYHSTKDGGKSSASARRAWSRQKETSGTSLNFQDPAQDEEAEGEGSGHADQQTPFAPSSSLAESGEKLWE